MYKRGTKRPSGKRSKLEDQFATILTESGVPEHYEVKKLKYVIPATDHNYLVDFSLENGIDIECKGYLRDSDERWKYELIKEQYPEVDLRFVFANPDKPISRTKMTHADWCDKVGFKWCGIKDTETIKEWANEPNRRK